jgi:hypothetical protein
VLALERFAVPSATTTSSSAASTTAATRGFFTSATANAEERPTSTKGLKPKILDTRPPTEEEQSEEVKQHNREMAERADRAVSKISNKDAYRDTMPASEKKEKDSATEYERKCLLFLCSQIWLTS